MTRNYLRKINPLNIYTRMMTMHIKKEMMSNYQLNPNGGAKLIHLWKIDNKVHKDFLNMSKFLFQLLIERDKERPLPIFQK